MPAKWLPSSAEQGSPQQTFTFTFALSSRVFPNFASTATILFTSSWHAKPGSAWETQHNASQFLNLVRCRIGDGIRSANLGHALRGNRPLGRERRAHLLENIHAFFSFDSAGGSAGRSRVQTIPNGTHSGAYGQPRLINSRDPSSALSTPTIRL
jgi:hypothetical protein